MTVYAERRSARFDYEIMQTFAAGIELLGPEVKSVRSGKASLDGSFVSIRGGEAYLLGADIAPYQANNSPEGYESDRARRLLLSKDEIAELAESEATKGLTIVPLKLYNKGRFLKLDVAIARGKRKFDKRESIKKRDVERDLKRTL